MNYLSKTLLISTSALALFACQAPSLSNSAHQPFSGNDTTNSAPALRTLSAVTCNDQSMKVNLSEGGIIQQGTLQGYHYCEYQIKLKAGEHLNVEFNSPAVGANVILFDRTDLSAVTLTQDGYTATKNETLPVRVLLTRNEARTSKQHPFSVKFTAQ